MTAIRFRPRAADDFHAAVTRRVAGYFRATGKSRYADGAFWAKAAVLAGLASGAYALVLWHPFPNWVLVPVALVYGVSTLLLGINVGHDAAHGVVARSPRLNALIQFGCFTLLGVNAYLWRLRHVKSHHLFPNVNGCDIDIDENPFVRLSPNQPWRPYFRFQHLYAPLAYVGTALHTILYQDLVYLFKRRLANLRDIRHPAREYALFVLSKVLYFGIAVGIPVAVLPLPWWQVVLGYLVIMACVSLAFIFLLIGTHFSDETEFPAADPAGDVGRTWAEHQLATACDWSPESRWAHVLAGGVNAHAAHHLFPTVCHTHYRAIARIIAEEARRHGVAYHRTTLPGMVRSHFAFLRRLGRRLPVVARVSVRNTFVPNPPGCSHETVTQ
jgi:linoleoyl-CoA desaturase